jgi:hypothetical protein
MIVAMAVLVSMGSVMAQMYDPNYPLCMPFLAN